MVNVYIPTPEHKKEIEKFVIKINGLETEPKEPITNHSEA
jgi:hypothetical protein